MCIRDRSKGVSALTDRSRVVYCFERTRLLPALLCLSATFGLGGTWDLLEGAEHLGCENPSKSTRTPSTLTLVGEHLEDDESSFEAAVFKGPTEPFGALLEGAAEPLDAILWGLAEPLEAVLGESAESLSVSEEPGPPEERTLDSVVVVDVLKKRKKRKKG